MPSGHCLAITTSETGDTTVNFGTATGSMSNRRLASSLLRLTPRITSSQTTAAVPVLMSLFMMGLKCRKAVTVRWNAVGYDEANGTS